MPPSDKIEDYWRAYAEPRGATAARYAAFSFGDSPEMANDLLTLVVGGDKRATAALAREYQGGEPMPKPGDYSIVVNADGEPGCIIQTSEVLVQPLAAADEQFAWDEGEGDRSLAWWMNAHVDFFERQAAAEGFVFTREIETVFERFRVVWPECPATVRPETPDDIEQVRAVTHAAFAASDHGYNGESELIDAVRDAHADGILSLVADDETQVVGHILFSPVMIGDVRGMGLAPMSVLPELQRQRVGAALVRAGLAELRRRRCPFVVVVGDPAYYSRFGFRPAADLEVKCEFDGVPRAAWMILKTWPSIELSPATARYVPEFSGAQST